MPAVLSSGSSPEFALQCRSHAPPGLFPWSVEQPTWCVSSSAAGGRRSLPAGRCGVPGMLAVLSAAPVAGLPGGYYGRCGLGPTLRPRCRLPAHPSPHADRGPAVSRCCRRPRVSVGARQSLEAAAGGGGEGSDCGAAPPPACRPPAAAAAVRLTSLPSAPLPLATIRAKVEGGQGLGCPEQL